MNGPRGALELSDMAREKVKILMADDSADKLMALESVLSAPDREIYQAKSGTEALRLLLSHDFAVILLDVHMPVLNGFETAALIRQRPKSAHTPIIFVTASSPSDSQIFEGYSYGAVDYLFTPVVPEVLRSKVSVFVDLRKKSQQIEEQAELLEKNHNLLRAIVEATPDLIFVKDTEGRYIMANTSCSRQVGKPAEEILGQTDEAFLPASDARKVMEMDREVIRSGESRTFEETIPLQGSATSLLTTKAPYYDAQRKVVGLIGIARDITERRQAEEKIRELNKNLQSRAAQLEVVNEELEAFSYSVSHDLRAPLRHINGFVDLLRKETGPHLEKKAARYLTTISEAAKQMGVLIDDLLALSRINRTELRKQRVSFDELVEEAIRDLHDEWSGREIEWVIPKLPEVPADPGLMRQVWINLLSNALKYSRPRARARIEIGAPLSWNGEQEFFVQDNGVGFDMNYGEKLFGVFQRLHCATDFEGTGIGLANVRRIVARHGGRTWAEGQVDAGATFHFSLPRAPWPESEAEAKETDPPAREAQPLQLATAP